MTTEGQSAKVKVKSAIKFLSSYQELKMYQILYIHGIMMARDERRRKAMHKSLEVTVYMYIYIFVIKLSSELNMVTGNYLH